MVNPLYGKFLATGLVRVILDFSISFPMFFSTCSSVVLCLSPPQRLFGYTVMGLSQRVTDSVSLALFDRIIRYSITNS